MSGNVSSTCVMMASSAQHRQQRSALDGDTGSTYEVRILDFRARVRGPAAVLRSFQALRPQAPAWTTLPPVRARTTFDIRLDTPCAGWHQLMRDGTLLDVVKPPGNLLAALDTAVNAAAVEALGGHYLLVHAGAVAYAGQGLLLPAAGSRGKTTLVAGLLAAGFQYLSDEVAVFDPRTQQLLPFAKSLGVKRGGVSALASLYPELAGSVPRVHSGREAVWYLPPLPEGWPCGPIPLRYVVVPRYLPRARTELVPIARTAALSHVVQQSFKLRALGASGLGGFVEALRGADCYALTLGHLQPAIDELLKLVHG